MSDEWNWIRKLLRVAALGYVVCHLATCYSADVPSFVVSESPQFVVTEVVTPGWRHDDVLAELQRRIIEQRMPSTVLAVAPPVLPVRKEAGGGTLVADAAPTPYSEVVRVLALLPTPEIGFVDFGCGSDARWCIAAAEKGWRATGVEINPARAAAARERVRASQLEHLVTIIEGDAITTDVQADVGVAYLYEDVLGKLKPRIEKLRAFASFLHRPPGVPVVKNGSSWLYFRPEVQRMAVWGNRLYSHPQCNDPRCAMCNAIRSSLAQQAAVAIPAKAASGHWVKRCDGKRCWMEWVNQ